MSIYHRVNGSFDTVFHSTHSQGWLIQETRRTWGRFQYAQVSLRLGGYYHIYENIDETIARPSYLYDGYIVKPVSYMEIITCVCSGITSVAKVMFIF